MYRFEPLNIWFREAKCIILQTEREHIKRNINNKRFTDNGKFKISGS